MKNTELKAVFLLLIIIFLTGGTACEKEKEDQLGIAVQDFMQQAAGSDLIEISTGSMAMAKGNLTEVKQFGQTLVAAHNQSASELRLLANQKNVILPSTIPQTKLEEVMHLQGLNGSAFDKEFASVQVKAHQEAISLYEKADQEISDADLRAYIDKTLPKLRMHLQGAEELKDLTD